MKVEWRYVEVCLDKWRPWHLIWHFVAGLWFKFPLCCILHFCFWEALYPFTGRLVLARKKSRAGWNECYLCRRRNP